MWLAPLLSGALIVLLVLITRPKSFADVAQRNRIALIESGEPKEVLSALTSSALHSRYFLRAIDEASGKLVMEEPMSLFRWGGLFEVEVLPLGSGSLTIDIAVIGNGFQFGGAIRRTKRRFVELLQATVSSQRSLRPPL